MRYESKEWFCHQCKWRGPRLLSIVGVLILSIIWCFIQSLILSSPCIASYVESETGAAFPDSINGIPRGNVTRFDNPALGIAIPYTSPELQVHIYIYDQGRDEVGMTVDDDDVKTEFLFAKDDIDQAGLKGELTFLGEDRFSSVQNGCEITFLVARYRFRMGKFDQFSDLYLSVNNGQYIKIRLSYPANKADLCDSLKRRFIAEICEILCEGRQAVSGSPSN